MWYIVVFQPSKCKHCQRHNGPEGWVHLTKVTSWGHITISQSWFLVEIMKMKFDQDLCKNLWYDLKKVNLFDSNLEKQLQQVLSCHLHMPGSHQWSLLNGSEWVSELVSQSVTDKHSQWSDSGPIIKILFVNKAFIQKSRKITAYVSLITALSCIV